MPAEASPISAGPASYRALFAVPTFAQLAMSTLLARVGNQMLTVALVLFVLEHFHSPQLAGTAVFLWIGPGTIVSPIAGALLDRRGRTLLIVLDYAVTSGMLIAIAVAAIANHLTPAFLLIAVALGSLTGPLSNSGVRSLFPLIVPRTMWDRVNAVDSGAFVIAQIAGPALAGLAVAAVGGANALIVSALFFVASAALMRGIADVSVRNADTRPLLHTAAAGLRYVVTNRSLRGLAITFFVTNLGWGTFLIALPVLVLHNFSAGPAMVGILWALTGLTGLLSGLLSGRVNTEGREGILISVTLIGQAIGLLIVAMAPSLAVVALGLLTIGLATGPMDIAIFSLRQRRTDPAWLSRAFAISSSLNFSGIPLGSAMAGTLLSHFAVPTVIIGCVAITVIAFVVSLYAIPRQHVD